MRIRKIHAPMPMRAGWSCSGKYGSVCGNAGLRDVIQGYLRMRTRMRKMVRDDPC